jgi:hypothetical protein
MIENNSLLFQLEQMLHWKKSRKYYADRLHISEKKVEQLINSIKEKENKLKTSAKILVVDIETSPLLAYVYQKQVWKARIGHKQLVSNWFMLTWAAKWLNEKETFSDALTSKEALKEDDSRIVTSLWLLLDEADIIIAHNGNKFDIPNINTRCVLHKLPPPSPYKQIDTLKVAQQQFGFTHNSLDALATFFGIEGKTDTDFQLWKDCILGKQKSLDEMEIYNINDIVVLEKIYHFLKPYIKGHPNLDLYIDNENSSCTTCGNNTLEVMLGKYFYTQSIRYPIYKCSGCGSISRAKKGKPYINKKLISSIPR